MCNFLLVNVIGLTTEAAQVRYWTAELLNCLASFSELHYLGNTVA